MEDSGLNITSDVYPELKGEKAMTDQTFKPTHKVTLSDSSAVEVMLVPDDEANGPAYDQGEWGLGVIADIEVIDGRWALAGNPLGISQVDEIPATETPREQALRLCHEASLAHKAYMAAFREWIPAPGQFDDSKREACDLAFRAVMDASQAADAALKAAFGANGAAL